MAGMGRVGINTPLKSFGIKSSKRNGDATVKTLYGKNAKNVCDLINRAVKIGSDYPDRKDLDINGVIIRGLFCDWSRYEFDRSNAPAKDKLHAVIKMIREKKNGLKIME